MQSDELRKKFIEYFQSRGHKMIPSASLAPENDPTALFISAGMQPLVPYLIGEKHPTGKRLVDCQKCIRTDDIDEVGDKVHHTFFEMLGNWSLGDYFKSEAIEMSFEFLTDKNWLGLDKEKLAISVFAGDADADFDQESCDKWISLGISPTRIAKLPKKNNWWGPVGETGPCGPDTEMFYWTGKNPAPENFQETCENQNWVEIWNDVFMQYNKTADGKYEPLKQKNVDTGMGLERMLAVMNGTDDNYQTDLFVPIIKKIEEISKKSYSENQKEFRIIADHIKAATFAISDGILPGNKGAGYVVRRLIRRAIVKAHRIGIKENFTAKLADKVFEIYDKVYSFSDDIKKELEKEETKFRQTLKSGLKIIGEQKNVSGKILFDLYQSFGLPLEISKEEFDHRGIKIGDETAKEFNNLVSEHQEKSRTASAGMFRGGLADGGEMATKYHTATHLLLAALREILGPEIFQKGSNITTERLRFDFNYPEKLSAEEISKIESLVNEKISANIPVEMTEMPKNEALKIAKISFDPSKYGDVVKVYKIDDFSIELCGGPHVKKTGELGHFKIKKEESSSAGIRRIKAVLE